VNSTKPPSSNGENVTRPAFIDTVDRGLEVALRVINDGAQGAGGIFERIGGFLSGVLDAFGKILMEIPGVGNILQETFHWLGTILSAGFDLVAILICSLMNLFADGSAGTLRILAGVLGTILARDGRLVRKGAVDILSGMAGAAIAVLAKTVALIQAAIFMQLGERALNEHEKAVVWQVYRNSVEAQNIRIVAGFVGLFSVNNRPFALGNRIYLKDIDSAKDPALFAHEFCHIWQFQRVGVRYVIEALWAQWKVENTYSWEAEIARGHGRWQDFNREAQAQFLQDVYNGGHRIPPTYTPGEFYDEDPIGEEVKYQRKGVDYTDLARKTVAFVRNKGISG